jgi:hypothetical protein
MVHDCDVMHPAAITSLIFHRLYYSRPFESTDDGGGGGGSGGDDDDVYVVIGTVCILCFLVCCIPSHHLLVW